MAAGLTIAWGRSQERSRRSVSLLLQGEDGNGLDWSINSGGGEKLQDCKCTLKIEPTGLADEHNMEGK